MVAFGGGAVGGVAVRETPPLPADQQLEDSDPKVAAIGARANYSGEHVGIRKRAVTLARESVSGRFFIFVGQAHVMQLLHFDGET